MLTPVTPKWYVRGTSGMMHSRFFRTLGFRIHMSQSHICNSTATPSDSTILLFSINCNVAATWQRERICQQRVNHSGWSAVPEMSPLPTVAKFHTSVRMQRHSAAVARNFAQSRSSRGPIKSCRQPALELLSHALALFNGNIILANSNFSNLVNRVPFLGRSSG